KQTQPVTGEHHDLSGHCGPTCSPLAIRFLSCCGFYPPCLPNATAPELPPKLYMRPARCPVLPVKNPSKLPVAPVPQLGVQPMLRGFGLGTPAIGVPEYAEKYWSR